MFVHKSEHLLIPAMLFYRLYTFKRNNFHLQQIVHKSESNELLTQAVTLFSLWS